MSAKIYLFLQERIYISNDSSYGAFQNGRVFRRGNLWAKKSLCDLMKHRYLLRVRKVIEDGNAESLGVISRADGRRSVVIGVSSAAANAGLAARGLAGRGDAGVAKT